MVFLLIYRKKPEGGENAGSPTDTAMTIVEEENEEEVVEDEEETEEGQEAPGIRKSKQIAKGKAKVIYPKNPKKKKKDLPQLDEALIKRRKLLDAPTAATIRDKGILLFCFLLSLDNSFSFLLTLFFFVHLINADRSVTTFRGNGSATCFSSFRMVVEVTPLAI